MVFNDKEQRIQALIDKKGVSSDLLTNLNSAINFPRDVANGIISRRHADFRLSESIGAGLISWFLYNDLILNSIKIFDPDFIHVGTLVNMPHLSITLPFLIGPVLGIVSALTAREARIGRALRKTR